jgi:uncharacterized protein YhdP
VEQHRPPPDPARFRTDGKDAGKLLDRLGYGDTVRRGTARLAGDLQWSGPLTGLHYPTLSGQLTVAAQRGSSTSWSRASANCSA